MGRCLVFFSVDIKTPLSARSLHGRRARVLQVRFGNFSPFYLAQQDLLKRRAFIYVP